MSNLIHILKSALLGFGKRSARVFLPILILNAGISLGSSATSYTNWPQTDVEWVELTNHISWCHRALLERMQALGPVSEAAAAAISPSYVHPFRDYVMFADKIESLIPSYVCQTNELGDNFKTYFTTALTNGGYPSSIPVWTPSNFHQHAFGGTNWATNSVLHAWMTVTNRAIQGQVAKALTNLIWTASVSYSKSNRTHRQKGTFTNFGGEPRGRTNTFNNAVSFLGSDWSSSSYATDGYYSDPIYSVSVYIHTYFGYESISPSSYVIGSRSYAKPYISDISTNLSSQALWYLPFEHHPDYTAKPNFSILSWYNFDTSEGDYWPDIQTNHVVFVEDIGINNTPSRSGNYPFYGFKDDNPFVQSGWNTSQAWGNASQPFKLCHTYSSRSYWLLKWNVQGGFSMAPPTIHDWPLVENKDTDLDDIVEVQADITSLGPDSGTITLTPQNDSPCVLIPVATPPLWYAGLFVQAYLSQGAFTNLPYHYLSEAYDQDGYYMAFSLKTRIEESGSITNESIHLKRVELVRPRGNVVVFDFPWTGQEFSVQGYPTGTNGSRSYVLLDCTTNNHGDKAYDLHFASGIIHSYAADGSLNKIRRSDGLEVSPSTNLDFTVTWGNEDDGPATASDARYVAEFIWKQGLIKKVSYKTKTANPLENLVSVGHATQGTINKLSKTRFQETSASLNTAGNEVTYGLGSKLKRIASAPTGARSVILTYTVPGIGQSQVITEFNDYDRVTKSEVSANGSSAITQYRYYPFGSSRYPNGGIKGAKLKEVTYPAGGMKTLTYTDEGWIASESMQLGGGNTRKTVYEYTPSNSGDAANPTNWIERPRKVKTLLNETAVESTLFSYSGASVVKEERCKTSGSAWEATGNLRYETTYGTTGLTACLVQSSLSPLGSNSCSHTTSNSLLHAEQTHFDGRTSISEINAFGSLLLSQTDEAGHTTSLTTSDSDGFGRPTTTTYRDGSTRIFHYGSGILPDRVQNEDGASSTLEYYPHGLLKKTEDGSTDITTEYEYDPLGNLAKLKNSAGGKTTTEEFKHDALGRITRHKDIHGAITTHSYTPLSGGGVTKTSLLPTGGTLVEKIYSDGRLKEIGGTASPKLLSCDRSVVGGEYQEKVFNTAAPSEYSKTSYSFQGETARIQRPYGSSSGVVISSDEKGRPIKAADEENVSLVQTYDASNRVVLSGIDMDNDGVPDAAGTDRIRKTQRVVSGSGVKQELLAFPTSGSPDTESLFMMQASHTGLDSDFAIAGKTGSVHRSGFAPGGKYTLTISNPDGTSEVREYVKWQLDNAKRLDGNGATIEEATFEYDGLGNLERVKEHRNGTDYFTRYTRDGENRVTSIQGPDTSKAATRIYYFGNTTRIRRIVRPDGSSAGLTYDDAGRLKALRDSTGHDADYKYDSQGRQTSMTTWQEGAVQTTTWNYDETTGLLQSKSMNGSTRATYHYRDNGQLDRITDANGVDSTVSYDAGGAVNQVSHSDGTASISKTYDRRGNLASIGFAGGISESYTHTASGQPLTTDVSGGGVVSNAQNNYSYASTHDGLLSRSSAIQGQETRVCSVSYDTRASATNISEGSINATYGYAWGTLVTSLSITNAGGVSLRKSVSWDYANNRPLSITYRVGDSVVTSNSYQYQPNNDRLAEITKEDGSRWKYEYDNRGSLVSGKRYFADGSDWLGRQFAYSYDSLGNAVQAGPLAADGKPRYSFSSSGQNVQNERQWGSVIEVSGTAATNAKVVVNRTKAERRGNWFWAALAVSNQASAIDEDIKVWAARAGATGDLVGCVSGKVQVAKAVEVPSYDNNLSLTEDSRREFVYNAMGWLIEARNTGLAHPLKVNFDYYPDGRRARKIVCRQDGTAWLTNSVHEFYYDGWNMIAETITDSSTSPVKRVSRAYTWGLDLAGQRQGRLGQDSGGIDGLMAITEVDGSATNVYYPIGDHHGTILKLVDGQTGAVVADYDYDPFGVLLSKTGAKADLCPFRFTSKYYDPEIGLYYFGYRYYDPTTTKWLTLDPLGEEGGINLTAFCGNDPVNKVDSLGLVFFQQEENDIFLKWRCETGNPVEEILLGHGYNNFVGFFNVVLPPVMQLGYTATPQPQDTVLGAQMMARGTFERGIAPIDRAKMLGLGFFVGMMGMVDTVDFVPDPTDPIQRTAREAGAQLVEKYTRNLPESDISKSLVRSGLPELKGSVSEAFRGPVRIRTFKAGDRVYRSPNLLEDTLENTTRPGPWLSTRRTATKKGTQSQLNAIKWGNPLVEIRTYEFTTDISVYYGGVAGGTGYQILIPRDVDPAEVLRYIEKAPLK